MFLYSRPSHGANHKPAVCEVAEQCLHTVVRTCFPAAARAGNTPLRIDVVRAPGVALRSELERPRLGRRARRGWAFGLLSRATMIDLYSDTVTKPTRAMFDAMAAAALGDDQRGDDTMTQALERRVAALLSQPRALVVPSATMANQLAVMLQAAPGTRLICHAGAHIRNFEAAGVAANAGVQISSVEGPDGTFTGADVERLLTPDDPHLAPASIVVVENTSNVGGGSVWSDEAFTSVVDTCQRQGLALHLDGARLFNAAVAKGCQVDHWARSASSVQLCFSKGLGCPFGAVLAGSDDLIARARRMRQRLGGALRQTGVIAAAMLHALDHHVERLAVDHAHLRRMVRELSQVESLELYPAQTNILYFNHRRLAAGEFAAKLKTAGVWVSQVGDRLRLCTHLDVGEAEVSTAIRLIALTASSR